MTMTGICPKCGKLKSLVCRDEKTNETICRACFREKDKGVCPVCGHGEQKPILLLHIHPITKQKICPVCYLKATGQMRKSADRVNRWHREKYVRGLKE
jgi:hypothetical protein